MWPESYLISLNFRPNRARYFASRSESLVDFFADQFAGGKTLGNIKGDPKKVLSTGLHPGA